MKRVGVGFEAVLPNGLDTLPSLPQAGMFADVQQRDATRCFYLTSMNP